MQGVHLKETCLTTNENVINRSLNNFDVENGIHFTRVTGFFKITFSLVIRTPENIKNSVSLVK